MWVGGSRVVILKDGKEVLMLRQHQDGKDIWLVHGGAIETGENSAEAAVREVKEETGLDVAIERLIWHVEEVSEKRGQRFVNFFLARIVGGELELGGDPERSVDGQVMREIKFVSKEEMQNLSVLYPEYLKDELWTAIEEGSSSVNAYKIRK